MSHYKHNLRDLEFTLFEVLGRQAVLGTGPFDEVDADTAREMLHEVARLATDDLAPSLLDSDRNPPVYDPATYTVRIPESFKRSYRAYVDAEFWRADVPVEPLQRHVHQVHGELARQRHLRRPASLLQQLRLADAALGSHQRDDPHAGRIRASTKREHPGLGRWAERLSPGPCELHHGLPHEIG